MGGVGHPSGVTLALCFTSIRGRRVDFSPLSSLFIMHFRSFIVFLVLALLAVDTMANSRPAKKAMRNSLVRFGKRAVPASSDFSSETAPGYGRWEYYNRLAGLDGADAYNL